MNKAQAIKADIDAALYDRHLSYPHIQARYREAEAVYRENRLKMETIYSELFHVERGSDRYHALKEQYRELGDKAVEINNQLKEVGKEGEQEMLALSLTHGLCLDWKD